MVTKLTVGLIGMVIFVFSGAAVVHAQKPTDAIESAQSELTGLQTDLLEVKRMSDNTIRVRWRWRNTTDKVVKLHAGFGDREENYLLDPVNKKKHFVVKDAKGNVIGSSTYYGYVEIEANKAAMIWARFPAPPPAVNKITVVIAKTPPFEDVAISK